MVTKYRSCPECGGTRGFVFKKTVIQLRLSSWNTDNEEEVSSTLLSQGNYGECQDCGKRIRVVEKAP